MRLKIHEKELLINVSLYFLLLKLKTLWSPRGHIKEVRLTENKRNEGSIQYLSPVLKHILQKYSLN